MAVLGIIFLFFVAKTISSFKEIRFVGNDVPAMNVISVTGKGEIIAKPDTATFTFSVTEDASTMKEAQDAVSTKIDAIITSAKDLGISTDDIKTTSYTSYPKYKYDNYYCYGCERSTQNEIVGYTVSQETEIKVKNQDLVSPLATLLADNKVANLMGPNYYIYDEDSVRDEARAKAIQDAKNQAQKLADELGVKLGRIVNYSDDHIYPYSYATDSAGYDMMAQSKAAPEPSLQTGTNTITENVTITYEIK